MLHSLASVSLLLSADVYASGSELVALVEYLHFANLRPMMHREAAWKVSKLRCSMSFGSKCCASLAKTGLVLSEAGAALGHAVN